MSAKKKFRLAPATVAMLLPGAQIGMTQRSAVAPFVCFALNNSVSIEWNQYLTHAVRGPEVRKS